MTMLFLMLLKSGCASKSCSYCDIAKPIWFENMDELYQTPKGIVRQIVEHNEVYQEICQ